MPSLQVASLLAHLRQSIGVSGGQDAMRLWISEVLAAIRDQEWAWNWNRNIGLTFAGEVDQSGTFTWAIGDDYLTCIAPLAGSTNWTGRIVRIDSENYRIVDYGLTSATKVHLDRKLVSASTGPTSLTFYRDRYSFRTSGIRNVQLGTLSKLSRIDEGRDLLGQFKGHTTSFYRNADVGDVSVEYVDTDYDRITAPAFPPKVVTSGAGTFTNGVYDYGYTRYSPESGLESSMGPVTRHTVADGFETNVTYDNSGAADQSEWSTYKLRLYRSDAMVPGKTEADPAMYLIEEREAKVPGAPFVDKNGAILYGKAGYWTGSYCTLYPLPVPSAAVRLIVDHVNSFHHRLSMRDIVEIGSMDSVMELFRLFFAGVSRLKGGDPKEHRAAIIAFRQQLAYLVTQSRASGKRDKGDSNYHDIVNVRGSLGDGSWVDNLPWKL
ncbi:MAG: hypothetical protein CMK74_20310 [Pseudomonadales bacterium]|nr:hypothetical protein [Pseudomonadales bacterium]